MKRSYGSSEKGKHDVEILYERQNKKKRHRDEIGGSKDSENEKNNLELYLENIFEDKCLYKIKKDEVRFIQEGIEKLVKDVFDLWLSMDNNAKALDHLLESLLTSCEDIQFNVYIPTELDSRFQKYAHLKADKLELVKVGSFYEGTKNTFPDEFDIVCLILCIKSGSYASHISSITKFLYSSTYVHQNRYLEFTSEDGKKISFSEDVEYNGPALTLKFVYKNEQGEERTINVDLVRAVCIHDAFAHETLTRNGALERCKELKTFNEKLQLTDKCLYTSHGPSLVHLEKNFLKKSFSRKHIKVYRILKYLINGLGDGEKLKKKLYSYTGSSIYSSYHIKLLMINHHDVCKYSHMTDEVGPCVLQILEDMQQYTYTNIPGFKGGGLGCFILLPYLKQLIEGLTTMNASRYTANYTEPKNESISGQFLHDIVIKSNVPRVCKEAQKLCINIDDILRQINVEQFLEMERTKNIPTMLWKRYFEIHPHVTIAKRESEQIRNIQNYEAYYADRFQSKYM